MTKTTRRAIPTLALLAACSAAIPVLSQQPNQLGYDDTPMQPSGKWRVHDSKRPQPRVITPGPEVSIGAPADATVLLGSRRRYRRLADVRRCRHHAGR